jgi:hypothetical protein
MACKETHLNCRTGYKRDIYNNYVNYMSDPYDITEILLKVALNTMNLTEVVVIA